MSEKNRQIKNECYLYYPGYQAKFREIISKEFSNSITKHTKILSTKEEIKKLNSLFIKKYGLFIR
jgi:hypothetical protein